MFKIFASFFLTVFTFYICAAHEEPSKTLYEKSDKQQKQQQILKSKIKTATAWKYVFDNNKQTDRKNKAFVMGYDAKGNFVFIEAWKNDSLQERDEYTYNSAGDMLSENDLSFDGKILEKNAFNYDKEGRVISGESKSNNDSVSESFKVIHSADKKSIDFVKYNNTGKEDYKLVYKYAVSFDKSDYTEAIKYDASGKIIMKVTKKYNAAGKQTEKTIYTSDLKISYTFCYDYDSKGNNSSVTKKNSNGSIEWKDIYSYDSNGNCTGLKSYNSENAVTAFLVYTYEYYK